jgi:hypothetical protein
MDKQLVDREAMPTTIMARAFLDACLAWAARQSGAKTVAFPHRSRPLAS